MKSTGLISADVIERRIFLIRGHKVMLGPYLASLYGIETRVLMQAVRRNIDRLPDDFMFALTREEIEGISQIVTSLPSAVSWNRRRRPLSAQSASKWRIGKQCTSRGKVRHRKTNASHLMVGVPSGGKKPEAG